jgi:hypothetical protein
MHWLSWGATFFASDTRQYQKIAAAAPSLTGRAMDLTYAQRFIPHWLVGDLHAATGLGLHATYRIASLACLATVVFLVDCLLARTTTSLSTYALCMGLVISSPELFRPLLGLPGQLGDTILVVGSLVVLLGLLEQRGITVVVGLVVAASARQTAYGMAPLLVAWMLVGPGWRELQARRRIAWVCAVIAAAGGMYALTTAVADQFEHLGRQSISTVTILSGVGSVRTEAEVIFYTFAPLAIPAALVAASALATRRRGDRMPVTTWWVVALAASISLQPLLLNPDWTGRRAMGLAMLALPSVAVGVALAARPLGEKLLSANATIAACALLAAMSLRNIYSNVGQTRTGYITVTAAATAALIALAAAAASGRAATSAEPGRAARSPTSGVEPR